MKKDGKAKFAVFDALSRSRQNLTDEEKKKAAKFFLYSFFVMIIAASIQNTTLNVITSVLTLTSLFLMIYFARNNFNKPLICVAILASIISGCSWPVLNQISESEMICQDILGRVCGQGVSESLIICGVEINDISVQAAKENGNLEKVVGFEKQRGYGLVSWSRVTVYGQ